MNIVKGSVITAVALLVVYVFLAFFSPASISVERSIEINSSPEKIWKEIASFEKWDNWSPWAEKDSTIVNTYSENQGEVGSEMSWISDSSGVGKMNLLKMEVNKKLEYELTFTEPWQSSSEGTLQLSTDGSKTDLTWTDKMNIPFFFRPMVLAVGMNAKKMDEMMGPDFENGLSNIKRIVEGESNEVKIEEYEFTEKTYLGIRHNITIEEASNSAFYEENFEKLKEVIAKQNIQMVGMPVSICFSWNEKDSTAEIMPAIPVNGMKPNSYEGCELIKIPNSKSMKAVHHGAYQSVYITHVALEKYFISNNLNQGLVIEEYANDPTIVSENQIITNVFYLLGE